MPTGCCAPGDVRSDWCRSTHHRSRFCMCRKPSADCDTAVCGPAVVSGCRMPSSGDGTNVVVGDGGSPGTWRGARARPRKLALKIASEVDVFGTEVDDPVTTPNRVGGDDHSQEDVFRRAGQERPVLERAGLTLIGIADDVLLVARGGSAQLPLQPGSKPCTTVPAQPGFGYRRDRLLGRIGEAVFELRFAVRLATEEHRPPRVDVGLHQVVDVGDDVIW